jgi:hypothetical protein
MSSTNNIPTKYNMQYLTSYGIVDSNNIIAILNKQAVLYGFMKINIFSQEPIELTNQFYFKDHYSLETLQRIMLDIGATRVSTAEDKQYKAL